MYKSLGRFATTHPWLLCAGWLLAGTVLAALAPSWESKAQDDDINFLPARCDSVRGYRLLAEAFPQDVFASRLIFAVERRDRPLTKADFALVDRCVADLEQLRADAPDLQIGRVYSHGDAFIGKRLVSADAHCTLIQVALNTPFLAMQTRQTVDRAEVCLRQRLRAAGADAPRLLVTGSAGIGRDLIRASALGLEGTTLATVGPVVVVLLLVYRAPLLALVPLVTIGVSVSVALHLLALLTLVPGVHLVNISKVFAIVVLYGAGTDYCLFLISRYREELEEGHDGPTALRRSVANVGGALAGSAGTVICGLGLMIFAEFAKVRCAGPAIALSLAVALLASLTLTPAVLYLLGPAVFWPRRKWPAPARPWAGVDHKRHAGSNGAGVWEAISRSVVARPLLIWTTATLALAPLALVGMRVTPAYKPTGELAPKSDSVVGLQVIQQHFTAGEIGPLTVLLTSPTDWDSPKGRELIGHLSQGFEQLANVAEVRSLTQPLGKSMPEPLLRVQGNGLLGSLLRNVQNNVGKALERRQRAARDFYVAPVPGPDGQCYVTRLDVVMRSDPFHPDSVNTVGLIQTWLETAMPHTVAGLGPVGAECYGVTVNARDLATITESDRKRINLLVLAGIFLILLVLVRRLWLATYLLLTVLFSYFATLGATTLASTFWSGRPLGEVDWRVPFFLFTILVAVGEDYNILLMTRLLHERRRHGPVEGTRRALARTGGTISACGLIMAGTFATLMLAGLNTLVQIGFALAFGVLLDTFVVRPFLVPALVLAVWRSQGDAPTADVSLQKPHGLRRAC